MSVLQQAIQLDESLHGPVVQVKDDFAVGPIAGIYGAEGMDRRRQWWRGVLAGTELEGHVDNGSIDDPATVKDLVSQLDAGPDEQVWIWAAQNKHDVSGYYWLMSQLKDYQGRIYILYLNNLPFFNDKGNIFYPENLFAIPPREFLKAKKLARPITLSEFEVDPDEWKKLCDQNKMVRILEGGKKLVQHDEDFYDDELKKYIAADWQKASRVITQFLHKSRQTTGDAFLLWRLKQVVANDDFDVQGQLRGMKDFEIRRKAAQPDTIE